MVYTVALTTFLPALRASRIYPAQALRYQFRAVAGEWPCAEVHKTPKHVVIDVDTPGFGADDLEVEVEGHTLLVLGKPEHGHGRVAFSFTFRLPPETHLERLHATFLDGVLTVKGPLLRHDGTRTLEIEQQPHLVNPAATGS